MQVRDLIKELQKLDPHARVTDDDGNRIVRRVRQLSGKVEIVFGGKTRFDS